MTSADTETDFQGTENARDEGLQNQDLRECCVCWWRYDPAKGDAEGAIQPGTPFADLPEHWCCPECGAARHKFLRLP